MRLCKRKFVRRFPASLLGGHCPAPPLCTGGAALFETQRMTKMTEAELMQLLAAITPPDEAARAAVTQSSSMPSRAGKNPSAVTSIAPIHSSTSSASPHRRLRTVSCRSAARKSVHTSFGTSRAILTVQRAIAARAAPKVTTGRQHSRNSTFSLTICQNSRTRVSPTHAAPVFSGASLAMPGPSFK